MPTRDTIKVTYDLKDRIISGYLHANELVIPTKQRRNPKTARTGILVSFHQKEKQKRRDNTFTCTYVVVTFSDGITETLRKEDIIPVRLIQEIQNG